MSGKQTSLCFGPYLECKYALGGFGIPTDKLPLDSQGNFSNNYMEEYLHKQGQIGGLYRQACADRTDYPFRRDIILGRGKPYQEFPGNTLLAEAIRRRLEEYQTVDLFQKICLSIEIANEMKENGSRFLSRDQETGGWVDADSKAIQEKISSAFRTMKKRQTLNSPSQLHDETPSSVERLPVPDRSASYATGMMPW